MYHSEIFRISFPLMKYESLKNTAWCANKSGLYKQNRCAGLFWTGLYMMKWQIRDYKNWPWIDLWLTPGWHGRGVSCVRGDCGCWLLPHSSGWAAGSRVCIEAGHRAPPGQWSRQRYVSLPRYRQLDNLSYSYFRVDIDLGYQIRAPNGISVGLFSDHILEHFVSLSQNVLNSDLKDL